MIKRALAEVKSVESDTGEFEAVLSMATLDRDGEVVDAKAFEPLPDHISIDVDHGLSTVSTVGSGTPFYDGDVLKIKGRFASTPLAQEVRTLVTEGHVRNMSVAMAGMQKTVKDGTKHITKAELLNATFTPVPANREAVVLSAKNLKAGARNSRADAELIQAAHDGMAALGAMCSSKSASKIGIKAIVGSVEALQERVCDALEDAYGEYMCWLRGVVPSDAGGYCVFDMNGDSYRQDYTDDGAVVTLTGQATEVDIHEIVAPDADADRETDDAPPMQMMSAADSAEVPAAPAAETSAEKAADVPAEVKAALQARASLVALL